MNNLLPRVRISAAALLLCLATIAVYSRVYGHEFLRYDDDVYVTDNPQVRSGLSLQSVKWALSTTHAANWHPLTWLSLMLDCQLFGVTAGALHMVNVVFHMANTILLLLLWHRTTRRLWPSFVVAALFALHPLHVESVAWIAERKDVLSSSFWLLTMFAYVRYVERPSTAGYLVTLMLFALGLMSKSMLVTLPFVLLLLDYWPLDRFGTTRARKLLLEKVPFAILSCLSSAVTYVAQQGGGAVAAVPVHQRLSNAVYSYLAYVGKMAWPSHLAILYPYPVDSMAVWKTLACAMILAVISVLAACYGRKRKYLAVGWFWYLGTLVPVIGLVQVGSQAMADRYTYLPLVGLFVMVAFATEDLLAKSRLGGLLLNAAAIPVLASCAVVASLQLAHWKSSEQLFAHGLAVTDNNHVLKNNYGSLLNRQGKHEEAARYLAEALREVPGSPEVRVNYGNVLKDLGRTDEAIEQYRYAIKLDPSMVVVRYNLGLTLASQGKYEQAIAQYRDCLRTEAELSAPRTAVPGDGGFALATTRRTQTAEPSSVEVLSSLGYALAMSGDGRQAVGYYRKALASDPNDVVTHGRLALTLASLGDVDGAIAECRVVLKARPNDAEMHNNLGILLSTKADLDGAIASYQMALQIDPSLPGVRDNLSAAIARRQAAGR